MAPPIPGRIKSVAYPAAAKTQVAAKNTLAGSFGSMDRICWVALLKREVIWLLTPILNA